VFISKNKVRTAIGTAKHPVTIKAGMRLMADNC